MGQVRAGTLHLGAEDGKRRALAKCKQDKRREVLLKYADIIQENAERLGYLETIVVGKGKLSGAVWEPLTAAELFRC